MPNKRRRQQDPTITQRVTRNARERGLHVATRSQWGSVEGEVYAWRRKNKPHSLLPDKPADTLWAHISVTDPDDTFNSQMRTLERIGQERFGTGISYNWAINRYGLTGVGQPLDAKGSHTLNKKGLDGFSFDQNAVAIGVVYIGMPNTPVAEQVKNAYARLIAAFIDEKVLTRHFDFMPHSACAFKDCPCDPIRDAMPEIYRRAHTILRRD